MSFQSASAKASLDPKQRFFSSLFLPFLFSQVQNYTLLGRAVNVTSASLTCCKSLVVAAVVSPHTQLDRMTTAPAICCVVPLVSAGHAHIMRRSRARRPFACTVLWFSQRRVISSCPLCLHALTCAVLQCFYIATADVRLIRSQLM